MEPFGELGVDLSPSELRETAYEILVGACRSAGSGRRLTYVSSSTSKERSQQQSMTHKSAASKVKKALGLKPKKKKSRGDGDEDEPDRKNLGELMRVQMRVSEQTDSRLRRGFLRLAAGQVRNKYEFHLIISQELGFSLLNYCSLALLSLCHLVSDDKEFG